MLTPTGTLVTAGALSAALLVTGCGGQNRDGSTAGSDELHLQPVGARGPDPVTDSTATTTPTPVPGATVGGCEATASPDATDDVPPGDPTGLPPIAPTEPTEPIAPIAPIASEESDEPEQREEPDEPEAPEDCSPTTFTAEPGTPLLPEEVTGVPGLDLTLPDGTTDMTEPDIPVDPLDTIGPETVPEIPDLPDGGGLIPDAD